MKTIVSVITLLLAMMATTPSLAAPPTLAIPAATNVGASMATLVLQSSGDGTGYFTLLNGSGASCGSGTQVKAGQSGSGGAAPYSGSLPLTANVAGNYTIRNLAGSAAYTLCFTAESPSGSNLNTTPLTASFATLGGAAFSSPGWETVGGGGFSAGAASTTSLAFAPNGTPYVAYVETANDNKATVMKYNGSSWSAVESDGFSAGPASSTSLAFAPDGTPYVAYGGDDYNSSKATVMEYSTGVWRFVGSAAGFSAATAVYTSLAIAPDGAPHVAYADYGNGGRVTVMRFNGSDWSSVGAAGFSVFDAAFTSLAIAPDGTPFVAFADYGNVGRATVMRYDGSAWTEVGGAGFSGGPVGSTSLLFAPGGVPYVAFLDSDNNDRVTVMKFSNGAWNMVGSAVSADAAAAVSLAFAPDGTPHVAYGDGGNNSRATVMKYGENENAWSVVGSAGFSPAAASSPSLAFAPDGTPYVAYGDGGDSFRATVMKLTNLSPTISGTPATTAAVGIAYIFTPEATYAGSFSYSGTLPPGLGFTTTTGAISGTSTTVGLYSDIVITVSNSIGSASLPPFSIEVINFPDTGISGTPVNPTTATTAVFTFTSPDPTASFECQLDSGSFDPCASGVTYNNLAVGSHSFNVRARNSGGNADPTPASYSWTVNSAAPTMIKIGAKGYATLAAALLDAKDGDKLQSLATMVPEGMTYSGSGTVTLDGGYDAGWVKQPGLASPVSSLTITGGTLVLDQMVVK